MDVDLEQLADPALQVEGQRLAPLVPQPVRDAVRLQRLEDRNGNWHALDYDGEARLVGLRDTNGAPIYTPSLAGGTPSSLYGYPLSEVTNGAWHSEAATLLAADWSKFVVGVRQDITFEIFREGIISDEAGKVVFNAMQQDSKIMRVVFRVGFQVANPLTRINGDGGSRYPAGVITPA